MFPGWGSGGLVCRACLAAMALPTGKTYFSPDLVITASDQRVNAIVPTMAVTVAGAVPTATMVSARSVVPRHLHE